MQHYFMTDCEPGHRNLDLPTDISHHLLTVLRAKRGDQFELVLADHQTYLAELVSNGQARIIKRLARQSELPVHVVLACGVPKTKDKPELIVQKGTEMGASQIIFFDAQRSISYWKGNKRERKLQRLQKIAQGAAEQSHRNYVPTVAYAKNWQEAVALAQADECLVAWEESAKEGEEAKLAQNLKNLRPGQRLLAIFGPEGGLTSGEVDAMQKDGITAVGLGPRILRTETAPLYLMAAVSYQLELTK
ncbi:16S rRNA (uracil(1498)-N(3))-methyltransferase [Limosilactobacillus sp.]|uniref:16S rRNA (uracil(1498)-N(3))-methyltransferase n=1 Tax=Limosilactobacillus sp. TaxID=2773925 RepID=UPI00345EB171